MIKIVPKLLKSIADPKISKVLLSLKFEGYLAETGWLNSFRLQMPVDNQNKPLPWVTYPFIDFISTRLRPDFDVFEFGSGNSTLFYSQLVKHVYALENDKNWYSKIEKSLPNNAKLIYQEMITGGDYSRYASSLDTKFDMIIVDGRDRVNCCIHSLKALREGGVVVLDDSERLEYKPALEFFKENSYKEIQFWGMAPGVKVKKCTTVFYKDYNCLEI